MATENEPPFVSLDNILSSVCFGSIHTKELRLYYAISSKHKVDENDEMTAKNHAQPQHLNKQA